MLWPFISALATLSRASSCVVRHGDKTELHWNGRDWESPWPGHVLCTDSGAVVRMSGTEIEFAWLGCRTHGSVALPSAARAAHVRHDVLTVRTDGESRAWRFSSCADVRPVPAGPECQTFEYLENGRCTLCPTGYECDGIERQACQAGYFSTWLDEEERYVCAACPSGYTSPVASGLCEVCPDGFSCLGGKSASPCKYHLGHGAVVCMTCPDEMAWLVGFCLTCKGLAEGLKCAAREEEGERFFVVVPDRHLHPATWFVIALVSLAAVAVAVWLVVRRCRKRKTYGKIVNGVYKPV